MKNRRIYLKQSSKALATGFESCSEKIARRLSEELIILPSQKRYSSEKISQRQRQMDKKETDSFFTRRIARALSRHFSKFKDPEHLCRDRSDFNENVLRSR